jgi:hypothetical protein
MSLQSGSSLLQQRQEHAYLIGLIVAEWAFVEFELTFLFSVLTGHQRIDKHGQFFFHQNHLAVVTLDTLEALRPKLELMTKACAPVIEESMQKEFSDLIATIRGASKGRHMVAHGRWSIDSSLPGDVILEGRRGGLMSYKVQDFADILNKVSSAIGAIGNFQHKWLESTEKRLRKLQEPESPSSGPPPP